MRTARSGIYRGKEASPLCTTVAACLRLARTTRACASHLAVALAGGAQQPLGSRREVLPLLLVDSDALRAAGLHPQAYAVSNDGKLFVTIHQSIYCFALWASISRYFAVRGINQAAEVPFQAVAQDDGTPGYNEPQPVSVYGSSNGDGFMMLWLGCRCSWPVTQLMWYQALGCQLQTWVAVVVDGFLSQMVAQAHSLPAPQPHY